VSIIDVAYIRVVSRGRFIACRCTEHYRRYTSNLNVSTSRWTSLTWIL